MAKILAKIDTETWTSLYFDTATKACKDIIRVDEL